MAKDPTKQSPNFGPIFSGVLSYCESPIEKLDKCFILTEKFARNDHRRLKLSHGARYRGLRAHPGTTRPEKTTRLSGYVERHYGAHKAGYPSGRSKSIAECFAILGATKTVVTKYDGVKGGEGGSN
jgi:hypothetical protein